MQQEYIIDKELKDMLVSWFEDIKNVSLGCKSSQILTIRNKAIRCSKFIQELVKLRRNSYGMGRKRLYRRMDIQLQA